MGGRLRLGICEASPMGPWGGLAQAQSLEEALSIAYWNSPTLKAERSALAALDSGVAEALSGWRSTISVIGGQSRVFSTAHDNDRARYTSTLTQREASVTPTQRIADIGKTSGVVRDAWFGFGDDLPARERRK